MYRMTLIHQLIFKECFYWRYTVGSRVVQFECSVGGKRIMDCQYGTYYYKPKQTSNKRLHLQDTRKMGCTAHIILRQYIVYPEYGIEN